MPKLLILLSIFVSCFLPFAAAAQDEQPSATPTAVPDGHVWTLSEILEEDKLAKPRQPIEYCQKGRFAPCVCWYDVAREMRYRPSVRECGGSAAVILSGKYLSVFSVVVRDSENRDRWPTSGYGGCSYYERDVLGLNQCSAFKVQKKIRLNSDRGDSIVHCLGASGYAKLFNRVVRVTAKLSDAPDSNKDPLVRWCLRRSDKQLN